MGKNGDQNLRQREQSLEEANPGRSRFCCQRCSIVLSRISKEISFRCVLVLFLSLSALLTGIFWILPLHHRTNYGFEAKQAIKDSATVQAFFKLQRPVSELVLQIGRLEYDIYEEIGVPDTKVAILSMRQSSASNWTDVVFGFLSNPINIQINPVSLIVLRSSLIELFLQQSNLTLTTSFGQPSKFEVLKFPGGITVIPVQSASIWQIPQILFNFTLNNSISEIQENFVQLKDQLRYGLHLRSYENVFVQITNTIGSTISPPVIVQASVLSDLGSIMPQRLKQLAQIITDSPAKNLGLDNSVFGKVKSVILSSYLKGNLHANPPTPSPAPSPGPSISPSPTSSPTHSPASSQNRHRLAPCSNCEAAGPSGQYAPNPENRPYHSLPPTQRSHAPHSSNAHPPCPYSHSSAHPASSPRSHSNHIPNQPAMAPHSESPPDLSPLPEVSYGSSPGQNGGMEGPVFPPLAPSHLAPPLSVAVHTLTKEVWLLGFCGMLIFHLL